MLRLLSIDARGGLSGTGLRVAAASGAVEAARSLARAAVTSQAPTVRPGAATMASSSTAAVATVAVRSNHYRLLGVDREATPQSIKEAFYRLVKQTHPGWLCSYRYLPLFVC